MLLDVNKPKDNSPSNVSDDTTDYLNEQKKIQSTRAKMQSEKKPKLPSRNVKS